MKGKWILIIGVVLLLLVPILWIYALSSRVGEDGEATTEANLLPMLIALVAGVVLIVVYALVSHDPRAGKTAHARMGEKAIMDRSDVDRTTERAGEVRRISGKWF